MHSTSCGSGFHSPFLAHVVLLVPFSTIPGGQVKSAMAPSIGVLSLYTTVGLLF